MLAAGVNEVVGIVNGTTNFILSAMTNEGQGYAEALARAQELGYAEADPTEDVNGADAAAKMAILASIAFHAHVRIDQVPHEGIDTLDIVDVEFANELGYAVKLLGRAALGERRRLGLGLPHARAARPPARARRGQLQRGHAARRRDPRGHAAGPRRRWRRDGDRRDRRPALGDRHARHGLPAARRLLPQPPRALA